MRDYNAELNTGSSRRTNFGLKTLLAYHGVLQQLRWILSYGAYGDIRERCVLHASTSGKGSVAVAARTRVVRRSRGTVLGSGRQRRPCRVEHDGRVEHDRCVVVR